MGNYINYASSSSTNIGISIAIDFAVKDTAETGCNYYYIEYRCHVLALIDSRNTSRCDEWVNKIRLNSLTTTGYNTIRRESTAGSM